MIPTVSVIIPAYRQPELLKQAIASVHNQTYSNIELIVIDDSNIGKGASYSRNEGIRQSHGKYIAFLDQDDRYYEDKIEKSIMFMELYRYPMMHHSANIINQPIVWRSGNNEMDITGYNKHKPGRCRNLLYRNYICMSTPVIERRCFDRVGLFDEQLFIAADWDMWLRIEECWRIGYLDMELSVIRSYEKELPYEFIPFRASC